MPLKELDDKLFLGSPDTVITGFKDGVCVFCKTYAYDEQEAEALSDLKKLQDAGIYWNIGHVILLKLKDDE